MQNVVTLLFCIDVFNDCKFADREQESEQQNEKQPRRTGNPSSPDSSRLIAKHGGFKQLVCTIAVHGFFYIFLNMVSVNPQNLPFPGGVDLHHRLKLTQDAKEDDLWYITHLSIR